MRQTIGSWGGLTVTAAELAAPDSYLELQIPQGGALPFGNGRSYGDSCPNATGTAIAARQSGRILNFDPASGRIEAEAGVLLSEIIAAAAPYGWFPPVLPGTQFVTLGGAIANDIHGKNHHRKGTFGAHVAEIHLDRSGEGSRVLTPDDESGLFAATVGGLGLTGLIRKAVLQLMPVASSGIRQTTTRFDNLEAYFELAPKADEDHEYAVAWIDSLGRGARFGRGHLIAGDHAAEDDTAGEHKSEGGQPAGAPSQLFTVPFTPPVSPLQGPFLKLFNEAYYRGAPAGASVQTVPFGKFFFPLDRVGRWNRLYGPRGLHQHQSVVPEDSAPDTVRALLECTQESRHGSFLTVLKRFGEAASPGFMSFPRAGYTLTLDFPDKGRGTLKLLEKLDAITLSAGGAVNPYKDRRMSPDTFKASFPLWQRLEDMRDPALISDFWRRTALDEGSTR